MSRSRTTSTSVLSRRHGGRTVAAIVESMIDGHPIVVAGIPAVDRVSSEQTNDLYGALAAYGDVHLVRLPGATWATSVTLWMVTKWNCLIDLWTAEEGRSDLELEIDGPVSKLSPHEIGLLAYQAPVLVHATIIADAHDGCALNCLICG
jgi:hypothetical protein